MKQNIHSSTSILFGKKTRMLLLLPVSAALMLACAEKNSNRKDNLSRLHSRPQQSGKAKTGAGTGAGTNTPSTGTDKPQDNATGLDLEKDEAPQSSEDALKAADDKNNQHCRITNSSKLPTDSFKQQFCDGVEVQTDNKGEIVPSATQPLHSLDNISAHEIKPESLSIDDKTRVAHILIQSKQSTDIDSKKGNNAKKLNKSTLILSYVLPEKFENVDASSLIVKLNNAPISAIAYSGLDSLPENLTGKFLFIKATATGNAKIQLLDVSNVNFDLEISYKLKLAISGAADQTAAELTTSGAALKIAAIPPEDSTPASTGSTDKPAASEIVGTTTTTPAAALKIEVAPK